MRIRRRACGLAAVLATLALAACSNGGPERTPALTGTAAQGPRVRIVSPADGQVVAAGSVKVRVEVEGFRIVDKLGQPALPGEGHLHFYVDVSEIPSTSGRPAITERGTYHAGTSTAHTWRDVDSGAHTFAVQLVNNDHTPLAPPVVDAITVTAR